MARQPRCPYCLKLLNSEDKVGGTIAVNGSIGLDTNFPQEVDSKRWVTNNTREIKICKACVIYAEFGIMPVSRKQLGELKRELIEYWNKCDDNLKAACG